MNACASVSTRRSGLAREIRSSARQSSALGSCRPSATRSARRAARQSPHRLRSFAWLRSVSRSLRCAARHRRLSASRNGRPPPLSRPKKRRLSRLPRRLELLRDSFWSPSPHRWRSQPSLSTPRCVNLHSPRLRCEVHGLASIQNGAESAIRASASLRCVAAVRLVRNFLSARISRKPSSQGCRCITQAALRPVDDRSDRILVLDPGSSFPKSEYFEVEQNITASFSHSSEAPHLHPPPSGAVASVSMTRRGCQTN